VEKTHQFLFQQRKVYELVEGYGEAARRAMEAGADAVEIHMAHGYLVSSFISQRTNKRVDEFGGSFEEECVSLN
jgi:2,4-dienoyl-CoA reductase-like NADH-dependent reductase (Old Yellow Enzyme family)